VERPVEPPAKVRLRDLGHQLDQLWAGEMFPQLPEQVIIHVRSGGVAVMATVRSSASFSTGVKAPLSR
jgi:hypothetical protein